MYLFLYKNSNILHKIFNLKKKQKLGNISKYYLNKVKLILII